MTLRKLNPIFKIFNNSLIDLPTPSRINYFWNFGSLLGFCLIIQILSGLFLSIHFNNDIRLAFNSVSHIIRDVNYGWLIRNIHANGASLFFILIYIHIRRGIFYNSYNFFKVWLSGVIILLILMGTAFLGYILPWGQISFWGATVITNLLSAIPYIGNYLTYWIWGGFSVRNATLNRFFSLHFILPFILRVIIIFHIINLHETGSNNPLGLALNLDKLPFHPYFSIKDLFGILFIIIIFLFIVFISPDFFLDPENFIKANPIVTPPHIQPEWYFLFAYAILRSIPNKLGGVLGLLFSIIILISLPLTSKNKFSFPNFNILNKLIYWLYIIRFCILTYLGACPVEEPFIFWGQIFTLIYFSYFLFKPIIILKIRH